jgi:carbohydrate diacid regulator
MKLLSSLAQRIVQEVTGIVNEEVIVTDDKGIIIAGSDVHRIGKFHEGAQLAVSNQEQFIITKKDVIRLEGVKAGLNLPIIIDKHAIGVIGITGEPEKVVRMGQLIQRMTELIIQEAYSSERLESESRGLETFVYEWVHSEHLDSDFMERAEILGISIFDERFCVLFELAHTQTDKRRIQMLESEMMDEIKAQFSRGRDNIIVRWGNGRFALIKHTEPGFALNTFKTELLEFQRRLLRERKTNIYIGAGKMSKDPARLYKSYQGAKKALRVSKKQHTVTFYDEMPLDMALADITDDTRKELIEEVLGPIIQDKELMETLTYYLSHNMSIKETAEAQHIHINTLHYRLKRIFQLTGKSVKEADSLVAMYMALSFYQEIK